MPLTKKGKKKSWKKRSIPTKNNAKFIRGPYYRPTAVLGGVPSGALYTQHTYTLQLAGGSEGTDFLSTLGRYRTCRANSPYDPDPLTGGRYAYGYEDVSGLYNYCVTYAAKIDVDFFTTENAGTGTENFIVGIYTDPGNSGGAQINAVTAINDLWNSPYVKRHAIINGPSSGNCHKRLSFFTSMANLFGVTRQAIMTDNLYRAATNANPTIMGALGAFIGQLDSSSAITPAVGARAVLHITYYSKWYDPKPFIAQSSI